MSKPTVVKEIECYLSNEDIGNQLLLLQYKNHPREHLMDHETIISSRMKPAENLLEIDIRNKSRKPQMELTTIRSCGLIPGKPLIGYFVNNQVHFVPIKKGLFMDTFRDNQKVPAMESVASSSNAEDMAEGAQVAMPVMEAPPPTAKPAAAGGKFGRPAGSLRRTPENDADLFYMLQQNRAHWKKVTYHKFNAQSAFDMRMEMLCPQSEDVMTGMNLASYHSSLFDGLRIDQTTKDQSKVADAKDASLEELIETTMLKVRVIRFNRLLDCLKIRGGKHHAELQNTTQLLQTLQNYALLVQGWWVVKSELVFPKGSFSEHASVPAEIMIRARDYIMAVFHRGDHLTRKMVSSITKLPTLEVTDLLETLAKRVLINCQGKANHWEFRPVDLEFVRKNPETAHQQSAQWELRIKQLCQELQLERLSHSVSKRRRCLSGRLVSESDSDALLANGRSPADPRWGPSSKRRCLQRSFSPDENRLRGHQQQSVASSGDAKKFSRKRAVSLSFGSDLPHKISATPPVKKTPPISPTALRAVRFNMFQQSQQQQQQQSATGESVMTLKQDSPMKTTPRQSLKCQPLKEDEENLEEREKLILDKFQSCVALRLSELQPAEFRVEKPADLLQMLRGELKGLLRELTLVKQQNSSGLDQEPMFVLRLSGDEFGDPNTDLPKLRDLLLDLFEDSSNGITFAQLREKSSPLHLNDKILRQLLKKMTVYKHSRYFLRGSIQE